VRIFEDDELFAPSDDLIEIGIGQFAVATRPKRLLTPALGSCVALALWDPGNRTGGLVHIMLPRSQHEIGSDERGRFAETAVPLLVKMLVNAGCFRRRLQAKLAGGAAMFHAEAGISGIGGRNVAEVRAQLALMSIPIVAEDTGEAHARTVELVLESGEFVVRSYQFGVKRI
jgi:chemotaxis protein CheD